MTTTDNAYDSSVTTEDLELAAGASSFTGEVSGGLGEEGVYEVAATLEVDGSETGGEVLTASSDELVADRSRTRLSQMDVALPESSGQRAFGIANRMARAATLERLYQTTVREVRKRFECDRAFIYQFESSSDGVAIAESLSSGYTPMLGEKVNILSLGAGSQQDYQGKPVVAITDASEDAVSPYQMQLLQRFQVQASLSLPIFLEGQIWGLLVVQQCEHSREWQENEISLLYQVSTEMTIRLQDLELQQRNQKEIARGETLGNVIRNIRGFSDITDIFESTTQSLRRFLKADRVAVFQFDPDDNYETGEVVVESVDPRFVAAKEVTVEDRCFSNQMAEAYRLGRVAAISDIYQAGIADCYTAVLAQFEVRANLVVPLLKDNKLWGLFCIHQCSRPREWQPVEIAFVERVAGQLDLAMQQAEYLDRVNEKTRALEESVAKERLITRMTERLRNTSDVVRSLKPVVQDIRQLMEADRVGLYQFDPKTNYRVGEFVVEDVAAGVRSAMAMRVQDHCFAEDQAENYKNGRQWVVDDVKTLELPDCLVDLLAELQVRSSIVMPLLQGDVLWGLLAVHQCQGPREWTEADVRFVQRLAAQFNLALQQAAYLAQVQQKTAELSETAERERTSKEMIQRQMMELLKAVGPALEGDLTVRAQVTDTEVGTIASTYNTTLQSLQKIVLEVQSAADLVKENSTQSETSVGSVTERAKRQADALSQTLESVQKMMDSTEAVAKDAQAVEVAAREANQIVQRGDKAMNRSVDGIKAIRSTVAETNQRIKRLAESSQKVSKIVSLIGHFTTQTQLLALNASIEATRAGQYGRGFAVVADEVRSLARQSAEAATEIEQFVQDIQTGTAEVSTAMETGIAQVAEGSNRVSEARRSLTDIVAATDRISRLTAEITQMTHQQADEFKVVTRTMSESTDMANQTAESSSELTQAIQQVLSTAETLQTSASRFKVQ